MSITRKRGILHQENLIPVDQDRQRLAREEYKRQLEKQLQERQTRKAEQQIMKRKLEMEEHTKMEAHWRAVEQRKRDFPERKTMSRAQSENLIGNKETATNVDQWLA